MRAGEQVDLKSALAAGGPLEATRAVNLVWQLAAALDAAHANRSTHRAITPAGILLSRLPSGEERARLALAAEPAVGDRAVGADIHALTAVLYECLTGLPPDAPVSPPSQRRPGVPAGFDAVIARGMAANPDDRYRSAGELAAAAAGVLNPAQQRTPSTAQTRAIQLPSAPTSVIPVQPQWDPTAHRAPTVNHPHSQPMPPPPGPPWPPQFPPPNPPKPPNRLRYKVIAFVAVAVFVVLGVIAAIVLIPRPARHATAPAAPPPKHTYGASSTPLPFPGLEIPKSVSVDGAGDIYVLSSVIDPAANAGEFSSAPKQVLKLAAGAANSTEVIVPGVDRRDAGDLAVDPAGNLYLSDGKYVWEWRTGAAAPIRLPFRGLILINAIAIDAAGNVYAAGVANSEGYEAQYVATKLAVGATRETRLPFTDLYQPRGLAVDKAGNVYVGDGTRNSAKARISKLAVGDSAPTLLPFTAVKEATRLAVDAAGNVFVADAYTRVIFELPAGETAVVQIRTDAGASALAVDPAGNIFFAYGAKEDRSGHLVTPGQVFKLEPDR